MTAKTELMLVMYRKRFFVPTYGLEPPSSVMNSRRLMLNLPLQSRFIAPSAYHWSGRQSYRGTCVLNTRRLLPARLSPNWGGKHDSHLAWAIEARLGLA